MPQLASLTNDDEIECISALRGDQTDMTDESSWSFWNLHECWGYLAFQPLFSDRFHVFCGTMQLMTHNLKGIYENFMFNEIFQMFLITENRACLLCMLH